MIFIRTRGFEIVSDADKTEVKLPERSTANSAGYDFCATENIWLMPNETKTIWTDIKAYMQDDEVLLIDIRSSLGIKHEVVLANTIGVIDADYYNNPVNEGNIGICLKNTGDSAHVIEIGDKIAQGIFIKYLKVDDDATKAQRTGGIGSTGK